MKIKFRLLDPGSDHGIPDPRSQIPDPRSSQASVQYLQQCDLGTRILPP